MTITVKPRNRTASHDRDAVRLREALQQISHYAANAGRAPSLMAAALNSIAHLAERALAEVYR